MSDCSKYTCTIDSAPFTTRDDTDYTAGHKWALELRVAEMILCDINRDFLISSKFRKTYSAEMYAPDSNAMSGYSPCGLVTSGSITPSFSENVSGSAASIMYADIENDVYLLRRVRETATTTCSYQNPFKYREAYGDLESVAYFPSMLINQTISYELWIRGSLVKEIAGEQKAFTPTIQPIVWPMPSSNAAFFLGAPGYEWMNDTFFYWYNDPNDIGWPPCRDGSSESSGLTGFEKAFSDGGKDFFYAPWVRDNCFKDVSAVHEIWAKEAEIRFRAIYGGVYKPECAAAFSEDYKLYLWISQDIVGNYIKYADKDFYSFYLPEIKEAINSVGNQEITQAFLATVEGAGVCFPICIA